MALNTDGLVKMPLIQKLIILVVIIILMAGGYFFFVHSKLAKELETAQQELVKQKAELAKLETVEKDREKLDRELKEKERKLEKAKEKLPTETEMEKLLLDISDIGKQNGISFEQFTPEKESAKENLYIEVPISLKFNGQYLYSMNFFYKVATLPRIVNFTGISIKNSGKSADNLVDISCTAKTYKFKE